MARSKKGAHRGKGKNGGRGGGSTGDRDDTYRSDVVERADMHNERFEKYYRAQSILTDDEWQEFMETMRNPLPTTFRVAGSRQAARLLNGTIKDTHVPHLAGVVFEGESVSPPSQISWYPEGLAWQFNVSKKVLRKSPEFKKFHSFLVFETEVGNISRQEAVSMLPPLFLEVEPHHRVMDMCAAPGSKTAQLLEALHAQDTVTASSIPTGLLIANDSDHKRTHLLIHQSARLPSPALMVTNHDASIYPAIKIPSEQTVFPSGTKPRVAAKKQYQLLFDRILCDVPCSGDGTMRKNPGIWKHWQPLDGNGLHSLQLRILQRAMRMLKMGGRIVYSTCSMNPVENEAVIAAALKSIPGFELVDMPNHLPGLIHRPGITTWKPTVDRSIFTDFATYEDYIQSLPESRRADSKMHPSHWPPPPSEAVELNLTRCMRIYPHLQDTGGFFIAVLQKKPVPTTAGQTLRKEPSEGKRQASEVDALETSEVKKPRLSSDMDTSADPQAGGAPPADEPEEALPDDLGDEGAPGMDVDANAPPTPAETSSDFRQRTKGKGKAPGNADPNFKENPYTFISPEDPIIQTCIANLRLQPSFPASNLLVRNPAGEPVRSLYMTNALVKSIVQHNDYTRLRLVTCGTKVIGKQEASAEVRREGGGADMQFRVLGEGLPVVLPYIDPEAVLGADITALKVLMEGYYPLCSGFGEPFRSTIEGKATGSYVVRFQPGHINNASLSHDLVLPIWKSNVSVTLMIDKRAKSALSLRVFGEDITTAARDAAQKKAQTTPTPGDAPVLQKGDALLAVQAAAGEAGSTPAPVQAAEEEVVG
ncbi:Multisite-specific tRNA:(cytosine-C(5))-methyltransferase trm4b [Sparassis crispa]|uniref:Multisite-specific tRNA:(Cytosine-C(5))-methyltransferase trm4b n=1 Tax=Sparassis crispa TaxID=139825 RepID=A0A401GMX6_9APHY|nr:Multisite-specific tRNA:(cytosine-C(5))-methyltransferase trm4b [Sparassis crispa]GBE83565.1 Multisite-specific tRNA:(cytosine-C(5))-methyltransferase trm4b [Sparassis crispa]